MPTGVPSTARASAALAALLAGERGHLALQSGEDPLPYLNTIWNCASIGGMLPEQVWESAAIPAFRLRPGRPSGSAMPLLWSHAEFLKLLIAREHGKPVELLDAVAARYGNGAVREASVWHWRHEVPIARLEAGKALRIEDRVPFTLHFGVNGWNELQDREASMGPFGLWIVELSAAELAPHPAERRDTTAARGRANLSWAHRCRAHTEAC